MPFSDSCSNIRLHEDGKTLSADCRRIDGSTTSCTIALDTVLGNENGQFRWGWQAFSASARDIKLDRTTLHAKLCCADDYTWTEATVNLDDHIENKDGVLQGVAIPSLCVVPDNKEDEVLKQFRDLLESKESHELSVVAADDKEGTKTFYVPVGDHGEGWLFKTHSESLREKVKDIIRQCGHHLVEKSLDELLAMTPSTFHAYVSADSGLNMVHVDNPNSLDLSQDGSVGCGVGHAPGSPFAGLGLSIGVMLDILFGKPHSPLLAPDAEICELPPSPKHPALPITPITVPVPYEPTEQSMCPSPVSPSHAELATLQAELQRERKLVAQRDLDLSACHEEISTLRKTLSEMERQVAESRMSASEWSDIKVELVEVERSYAECKTQLEDSKRAKADLEYEVSYLKTEVENIRADLRSESQTVARITSERDLLRTDLKFSEARYERIFTEFAEYKRTNNRLDIEIRELKTENKRSSFVIMEREMEIHTLKLVQESLESTIVRLQEALVERDETIIKLEEVSMSTEVILTKSKREVYECTERVAYLTEKKAELEERISELQLELYKKIDKLAVQLRIKEDELLYASRQLSSTRTELEEVRIHLKQENYRFARFEGRAGKLCEDLGYDVKEAGILRKGLEKEVAKAMEFSHTHIKRAKLTRSVSSSSTLVEA